VKPIRTRRVPFFHSRPSRPLAITTLLVVAIGVWLPFSPATHVLGFTALPAPFFAFLIAQIVLYMVLIELAQRFYRALPTGRPLVRPRPHRRVHHRASRWSVPGHVPRRVPGGGHDDHSQRRPRRTSSPDQVEQR